MTGEALAIGIPAEDEVAEAVEPRRRLAALFDAHHQRLYRLARRMSRSAEDARDLVQDTFLRAARAPASVPDGMPGEEAWLVRVLVNLCRDRWRQRAGRARLDPLSDAGRPLQPADVEAAFIARALVEQALSGLPPRRRAILVLYELEGAAIPEIARLLGVAPVTVRWHLSRGRRDLANRIKGSDPSKRGLTPRLGDEP